MADNQNPRYSDKDTTFLADDDPLAELARIAGFDAPQPEPVASPDAESAAPDDFDFDLEAELLRSFDASETPSTFVDHADEPAAANPAEDANPVPDDIPAFLTARPSPEEFEGLPPDVVVDRSLEIFKADAAAPEDVVETMPATAARDDVAEEWTDLPEWPVSRRQALARIDDTLDLPPFESEFDPPAAMDEPSSESDEPSFVAEQPVSEADDGYDWTDEQARQDEEIARAFAEEPVDEELQADGSTDARSFEEAALDAQPVDRSGEHAVWNDAPLTEAEPADHTEPAPEPEMVFAVDLEEPAPAAPAETLAAEDAIAEPEPVETPVYATFPDTTASSDRWDIEDDLERAFRELKTGTLPGAPIPATPPALAVESEPESVARIEAVADEIHSYDPVVDEAVLEPLVEERAIEEPEGLDPVVDDAAWADRGPADDFPDHAEIEPVAVFDEPAPQREEPAPVAHAAVAAAVPAAAAGQDIDFDFDDFEFEMEQAASHAMAAEHAAAPALDPEPVAPPAEIPETVTESTFEPYHAETGAYADDGLYDQEAPSIEEASYVEEPSVDLAFDMRDVADTGDFIEPVGEIDVPELPRDEDWQAIDRLDDLDLSGVEAEFADILAQDDMTAPPAGQPDPAPVEAPLSAHIEQPLHAAPDGQGHQIDFADFDFTQLAENSAAAAGAAAAASASRPHSHRVEGFDDDFAFDERPSAEEPPSRRFALPFSRRTAAIAAVAVLGLGAGALALSGGGEIGSDAPRVIVADSEPIKIVPEDPGGRTVPNQDQAVYDQVDGSRAAGEAALVSRAEEPVDIVQRTIDPDVLPLEGRPMTESGSDVAEDAPDSVAEAIGAAEAQVPAVDPEADRGTMNVAARRVQTMIVRPDGTLVPRDEADETAGTSDVALAGSGEPLSSTSLLASADAGDTPDAAAASNGEDGQVPLPQTRPGESADLPAGAASAPDRLSPATPDATAADTAAVEAGEALSAPVRMVRTTALTGDGAPVPPGRPADQPVTIVGNASTGAGGTPAAPTEAPAEVAAVAPTDAPLNNPGGYVVQIASQPSEESARSTYQSLAQRYASVIGGRGVQIQAADIPDRGTYYRVRIAGGTREEAVALCERYQAAGGSCFVAR